MENIQPSLDPSRLVFIDESSINTGMTRLYAWAEAGERIYDYVPDVRFKRKSVLSSIRLDGTQVPFVFSGTLNKSLFSYYLEEFLAPTLKPGDIVIMDNCSVHRAKGVLDSIYARGASVLFLPPYSPEYNPIELCWSKMKTNLNQAKARTSETLDEALIHALSTISTSDIAGWFKHAGYAQ